VTESQKLHYVVVFGTRPELIKLAPVILEFQANSDVDLTVIFTGQHEISVLGLESFPGLQIDIQWNVMRAGQTLSQLSSRLFAHFDEFFTTSRPHLVIVHGDTHSALVGAMSAFFAGIEVAHVEAGLRTYTLDAPFPEEFNRQAIARIARYNFAPSVTAVQNLTQEHVDKSSIFLTGNTVVDSLFSVAERLRTDEDYFTLVSSSLGELAGLLDSYNSLHLVTAHRRENAGAGIEGILAGIRKFALAHRTALVVFAMHPNPVLQRVVRDSLSGVENIYLSDPFNYSQMVMLLNRSSSVVTDSGGIQEEAATLGVQVLVTRAGTERGEAIAAGLLKVVGTDSDTIAKEMASIEESGALKPQTRTTQTIYGDGLASNRIARILSGQPVNPWEPIVAKHQHEERE
jgi:UDP-N-acetylglucosamine 2-epimerase (non-hydrolysing)